MAPAPGRTRACRPSKPLARETDLVIVGGGVAGLTAALFAGRCGLRPVLVMDYIIGGQILNIERIVDFPGFPDGIPGYELGPLIQQQAEAAGAEILMEEVAAIAAGSPRHRVETVAGTIFETRALILAMGSMARTLGVPGEAEFLGRGVSTCASCDGPLYAGKRVLVVGGGDSALLEALTLADHAAEVLAVHHGPEPTGMAALVAAVGERPNISLRPQAELTEIGGEATVTHADVRDMATGEVNREAASGVFVYVGLDPKTQLLRGVVPLDEGGHVEVNAWLETDVPGIFAAGDMRQHASGQLVSAAGDGATAALAARRSLA